MTTKKSTIKENPTLSIDLIREILLRLPVRSVLRFKCVCKLWLSLISEPQFGISHYDLAASLSHRILFRSNRFYIESIDIESSLANYSGAVHLLLPPSSPPPPGAYACYANYRDTPVILGSCRGLIVLCYKENNDLILWNPSLGLHKPLPQFEYEITYDFLYGFGYDTSVDDYLIILIELYESVNDDESEDDECQIAIQILSFNKPDWFLFEEINVSYKGLGDKFRAGTLFNEALHWLVFSEDEMIHVIIAFDLIQRSLSDIPLFDDFTLEKYHVLSLRAMGGCLSMCCQVRLGGGETEIWMMKQYKVQSSWTKVIVIPTYDSPLKHFSPICITGDGQIFGSNTCARLEKVNYKGEKLDLLGDGASEVNEANLQTGVYRESLLSLPSVIGGKSEDVQQ